MREPVLIRMLPDQRRIHLRDGPIDLIIEADDAPSAVRAAYEAAARRFVTVLDELCAELPLLRSRSTFSSPLPRGPIAHKMAMAVLPYCEHQFITPMAAVAGAVAESVLAEMTHTADIDRAYVNNGGDIALHLAPGYRYKLGMIERPGSTSLFASAAVSAESAVRGVATSGWRGRSFSLGIADAVTVLAETAAQADAAATVIANAVDLPGHPAVTRIPAKEIAPDSDLGMIPVTREVGRLTSSDIENALSAGAQVAEELRGRKLIHSAALCLQGRLRLITSPADFMRFEPSQRSLQHA